METANENVQKTILTYEGLRKYEDELQDLKINRRKDVAAKLKEARAQGDLSENGEYDAAKDEQREPISCRTAFPMNLRSEKP